MATDLSQSASARPEVQNAISGVENCTLSPADGENALGQAIATRQNAVSGLQGLDVSQVPNGAQMVSLLTQALTASIAADNDYKSWMQDFQAAGAPCGATAATTDANYSAGNTASASASSAKSGFLALWNPIAPNYGQPTYTQDQL
jgi:hypothetical protein